MTQRLARGDQGALEDCYQVYAPLVRSYLRRFLPAADIDGSSQISGDESVTASGLGWWPAM
jgi:hypothetical protein